jgi:hypothetical protein
MQDRKQPYRRQVPSPSRASDAAGFGLSTARTRPSRREHLAASRHQPVEPNTRWRKGLADARGEIHLMGGKTASSLSPISACSAPKENGADWTRQMAALHHRRSVDPKSRILLEHAPTHARVEMSLPVRKRVCRELVFKLRHGLQFILGGVIHCVIGIPTRTGAGCGGGRGGRCGTGGGPRGAVWR